MVWKLRHSPQPLKLPPAAVKAIEGEETGE